MVVFKMFDNVGVHLPELAAVALVKYKNNMLVINRMALVFCNEYIQLLNRRYNNAGSGILKLFLQNGSAFVPVGSTFFKAVIFFDGLVVQIFTVNYKQNLINIRQTSRKLRRFE